MLRNRPDVVVPQVQPLEAEQRRDALGGEGLQEVVGDAQGLQVLREGVLVDLEEEIGVEVQPGQGPQLGEAVDGRWHLGDVVLAEEQRRDRALTVGPFSAQRVNLVSERDVQVAER